MGSPFGSDTTSAVGADRLLFTIACDAAVWALVSLSRFLLSELAKVYSLGLCLAPDVIFLQHGVVPCSSSPTCSFSLFQVSDIPLNKWGVSVVWYG